jgi:hypothetical protein
MVDPSLLPAVPRPRLSAGTHLPVPCGRDRCVAIVRGRQPLKSHFAVARGAQKTAIIACTPQYQSRKQSKTRSLPMLTGAEPDAA